VGSIRHCSRPLQVAATLARYGRIGILAKAVTLLVIGAQKKAKWCQSPSVIRVTVAARALRHSGRISDGWSALAWIRVVQ
jgi:hypothetical protein